MMVNFPFTLSFSLSPKHQTNPTDNNRLVHYRNYNYGLHLNYPPSSSIKQPFQLQRLEIFAAVLNTMRSFHIYDLI